MYICKKCNHTSENPTNFCPICGNQMVEQEPTTAESADFAYSAPVNYTYTAPQQQKPSLAKKIVGMALSIEGFVGAIITLLYAFIFIMAAVGSGETEMGLVSLVFTLLMAVFTLPGSIIGLCFSNSARNAGDTSAISRIGKALGLAGIIVIAVTFVISVFTAAAGI